MPARTYRSGRSTAIRPAAGSTPRARNPPARADSSQVPVGFSGDLSSTTLRRQRRSRRGMAHRAP
jgi:hypothetical protein